MLIEISVLLCGFSIFSLFVLLIAYVFYLPDMRKSTVGKLAATALILSLVALQIGHYLFLTREIALLETRSYSVLLLFVPISFYFFSRVILFSEVEHKLWHVLHYLPFAFGFVMPLSLVAPIGFVIGSAYTCWFTFQIYRLKEQRHRFKFELFFFSMFALTALIALALCLALPYIQIDLFYISYTNAISITVLMIVGVLLCFPKLLGDILLITELAYTKSKLGGVNIQTKLDQLKQVMQEDKIYQNEALSLSLLAEQLGLSTHQLSELINTHFNVSFPQFIREQRVNEAKRLLVDEPKSSILAVSLATGFKSQSNFYTAFKEITGMSPGQFRNNQ